MEYNSFMEALKGKQHKIDKNKNNKIDTQDFELLRKEETEQIDEIHRMKTKLNKLDPISNKSVARQKLSNLIKSGKARGALIANKMRTLNMGDDIDQEDLEALHEVLSKDAKASDWIHDFVHSTNPKFDGKTKKERIKMALGAYYGQQNEAYGSYKGYQSSSGASHGHAYGGTGFGKRPREDDEYHVPDPVAKRDVPHAVHINGKKWKSFGSQSHATNVANKIKGATVHKEEVEQIDELSRDTLLSYANKVSLDSQKHSKDPTKRSGAKASRSVNGYAKAHDRLEKPVKEEVMAEGNDSYSVNICPTCGSLHEGTYAGLEKEDKPGKIKTAVVKLHPNGVESETVEGWKDEKKPVKEAVQKVDIPAYLRKAKGEPPLKMDDLKRKDTLSDAENLKRNRGVKESFDDEGNLIPTKISYKDFINEIKLADLPVRRVQGHSYGANYSDPEGADDMWDKETLKKPTAEKRGRGRPAGSKAGARANYGSSKLHNK